MRNFLALDRRHGPNRRQTHIDAVIITKGNALAAVILNVSFEGMKLSAPKAVAPGTSITIEVMEKRLLAIVHWSKDGQIGVHLLERLAGQTMVALENATKRIEQA